MGQPLVARPFYGSRKEGVSFADSRLNAHTLCLLESLGVRHVVVGALSALKANDLWEEVVVCRSEFSQVLQAEPRSYTRTAGFTPPVAGASLT